MLINKENFSLELTSENNIGFVAIPTYEFNLDFLEYVNTSIKKLCDVSVLFLYEGFHIREKIEDLSILNNLSFDYVIYSEPVIPFYGKTYSEEDATEDYFLMTSRDWALKDSKRLKIDYRFAKIYINHGLEELYDFNFNLNLLHDEMKTLVLQKKQITLFKLTNKLMWSLASLNQIKANLCSSKFHKQGSFAYLSNTIKFKVLLFGDEFLCTEETYEDTLYSIKKPNERVNYINPISTKFFLLRDENSNFENTIVWLRSYISGDNLDLSSRFLWPNFRKKDVFNLFENTFSRGVLE